MKTIQILPASRYGHCQRECFFYYLGYDYYQNIYVSICSIDCAVRKELFISPGPECPGPGEYGLRKAGQSRGKILVLASAHIAAVQDHIRDTPAELVLGNDLICASNYIKDLFSGEE